jgi:ribosomal protein L40E
MTDSPKAFAEARDLFFKYDGSRFYMSRNDVEFDYLRFKVPKDLEEQWLAELAERKLALLDKPPNGGVLHYFWHHGDVRHLHRFIQTQPLGEFRSRCAYVQDLLNYIKICLHCYSRNDIQEALHCALKHAESLEAEATDDKYRRRARHLIESVLALRSATQH